MPSGCALAFPGMSTLGMQGCQEVGSDVKLNGRSQAQV